MRVLLGTIDVEQLLSYSREPHAVFAAPNLYKVELIGCLLTHWDVDQNSTETYPRLETLFDNHHSRILADPIPFDVTIEKLHGPTQHRASEAYNRVAQEVLDYVERI